MQIYCCELCPHECMCLNDDDDDDDDDDDACISSLLIHLDKHKI